MTFHICAHALAAPEAPPTLRRQSSSKAAELSRPRIAYEVVQGSLVSAVFTVDRPTVCPHFAPVVIYHGEIVSTE